MTRFFFLLFLFLIQYSCVKANDIKEIRELYYKAAINKNVAKHFINLMNNNDLKNSTSIIICYKGLADIIKSKYAFNPYSKITYFSKGKNLLERAILKDPAILILDEATASIDTHTERLVQKGIEEIRAEVVKPTEDKKPPPPPPPDLAKPPPPFVPPPEINISTEAPPTAITAVQSVQPTPPRADTTVPSKALGRTHDCQTFYPDISKRLNESGDVLVHYDVGTDGAITNVGVAKSSGSDRLDQAAVSCVSTRWRNTPAMNGSTPIASPGHQAIVRFSLIGH